jgi:hypothetical protein
MYLQINDTYRFIKQAITKIERQTEHHYVNKLCYKVALIEKDIVYLGPLDHVTSLFHGHKEICPETKLKSEGHRN